MRDLYALFSCDEWKSTSSMRLIGVFNRAGLYRAVVARVNNKGFELDGAKLPIKIKDIKDYFIDGLDTALTYAFVQQIAINEEL